VGLRCRSQTVGLRLGRGQIGGQRADGEPEAGQRADGGPEARQRSRQDPGRVEGQTGSWQGRGADRILAG
jgi:hypothetical protein